MKTNLLIILFIFASCALKAQLLQYYESFVRVYYRNGLPVRLLATTSDKGYQKPRGKVQWFFGAENATTWQELSEECSDSLFFTMDKSKSGYYRYAIKEGTCDTIYSTAFLVSNIFTMEGESLLKKYNEWGDSVKTSHQSILPIEVNNTRASEDKLVKVQIPDTLSGTYSLIFKSDTVNGGDKKLFLQMSSVGVTCLFEVYINGIYVGKLDISGKNSWLPAPYNDFTRNIDDEFKVRHRQRDGLNSFAWKFNTSEVAPLTIELRYISGGVATTAGNKGFYLDYLTIEEL